MAEISDKELQDFSDALAKVTARFGVYGIALDSLKAKTEAGIDYQKFKNEYQLLVTDKDVNEDWISYLDFRNYDDYYLAVKKFNPDYLFHLGAYTDLEFCEENSDDTYNTNTISVEYAVKIANELDIPILYISTAGIFDGEKDLYDDWDIPNPLGVYARSKYMGERCVVESDKGG